MKPALIILLFVTVFSSASAQQESNDEVRYGIDTANERLHYERLSFRLIDSANTAACNGDTSLCIKWLLLTEKEFPVTTSTPVIEAALGKLYLQRGEDEKAKEHLLFGLQHYFLAACPINSDEQKCKSPMVNVDGSYSRDRSEICVLLSKVYLKQHMPDTALQYLQLADGKYLPYKDCGNGIMRYRSYLSPYFADCYLAMGDTTSAINRLLDYFMCTDGNTSLITQKLKQVLLLRYTQEQINTEITNSLKRIKPDKIKSEERPEFILFGHKLMRWGYPYYYREHPTVAKVRSDFLHNKSILMLTDKLQ